MLAGGQGVRAADLLVTLVNEGSTPSQPDTISRVFDSLVAAKQADKAEALLSVSDACGGDGTRLLATKGCSTLNSTPGNSCTCRSSEVVRF
jgi:hypothetical protein